MRKRHAKLLEQFAEDRPNWATLAAEFGAMALFDAKGQPPSADVTRRTWWQVRHDLAAKAARKQAKAAASAAGVQAVSPPAATIIVTPPPPDPATPELDQRDDEPEFTTLRGKKF
jgi:hypothetical protein